MIQVPLQAIPNQSLSIQFDNKNYDLEIRACNSGDALVMAFDVAIDNVLIVQGIRSIANYPIIPYAYLQNGNFVLLTSDDDLPDYTKFQISQYLIYASQAEIEAILNESA